LRVGVGRDELDTGKTGSDHRVDGVAAAASDAHNLDASAEIRFMLELDHLNPP
jgi:hypothetical protein